MCTPFKTSTSGFSIVAVLALLLTVPSLSAKVDFGRDIRPILSENCFHCHGPDEENQKAGLRLDTREGATEDLGGYAAIAPSSPESSELLKRMLTNDEDDRMPPAETGKVITDAQKTLIRQWISEGAEWGSHWAFESPKKPNPPVVKNNDWTQNPIDQFVRAKLEKEGLTPSKPADKIKILRRLHLDITGLPPTPEEVDAFLASDDPLVYERKVTELLKSPHYGERWGRHWLDAARYADSDGFEKDKPRNVWLFREWVINALNDDLPYNQFVIEQIAGDLIPNATQSQKVATGFLRNSMINEEGGVHPEQFRMEAMFDRMDAIGKSVLGLTIQCAQCHTHKYDPLTHTEYYKMFAFLNDSAEGSIAAYGPNALKKRANILRQISDIEEDLRHKTPEWQKRMAAWETSLKKAKAPDWNVLSIGNSGNNAQRYYHLDDKSLLAQGYAPSRFTATFTNNVTFKQMNAIRLEALTDPNLPGNGPGRAIDGRFALSEIKLQVENLANPKEKKWVKFTKATADFSNKDTTLKPPYVDRKGKAGLTGDVGYAIDGKNETAWGADAGPGRRNESRNAVFLSETNFAYPEGSRLTFHLVQQHGGWNSDDTQTMNLGRFRISVSDDSQAKANNIPFRVRNLLKTPASKRTPAQQREIFSYWRTTVPEWESANSKIAALWEKHPGASTQLVMHQLDKMRSTHRLDRGDFLKPAEKVQPGVPAFLNPLPEKENYNRLDFAKWLVADDSPTAARAIVNRVWQSYFGIGIVETSEDLGSQAAAPSHPGLLDWLAVDFMENDWSLKRLHRLITTSATYRQDSSISESLLSKDPYNRLLARGPRFRVEGEVVRDIALSASGLLDRSIGGPSVFPPAPAFLFKPPNSYGPKTWNEDKNGNRYRRALYTFRFRSVPYPMLQAFDTPNGDISCVRRSRSNTPLQALTALNEPVFLECAIALAQLTLDKGGKTTDEQITFAFRRCLSRSPDTEETKTLKNFLNRQLSHFNKDSSNPTDLIGSTPTDTPVKTAAWTALCRVLLNLDETITKE